MPVRRLHLAATLLVATACQCGAPGTGDNLPPQVRILSPADGAILTGPGPYAFIGEASDPEDPVLPAGALRWSSSLNGVFGTGPVVTATLSPGSHRITLEAVDSSGAVGQMQISVKVSTASQAPEVSILEPEDGSYFDQGMPIPLRGQATDGKGGLLTGAALTWTSNLSGLIGTGAELVFANASLGEHRIVLTAVDPAGASAQASVALQVVLPGANRPPTVRITRPADGASFPVGTPVVLEGTATDPEDGALFGDALSWTSSLQGPLGTGGTLTLTQLQQGVHTLRLSAVDSDGASSSAAVNVSINTGNDAPPVATITSPQSGFTTYQGTSVTLVGTGVDPEDGTLAGSALSWSSDRDGQLGTGSPFATSQLSAGTHQIVLAAKDSAGNTGVASIQVIVLPQNQPPAVTITSPAQGASYPAGTLVQLRGSATDPEDGPLTGTSLTWSSSLAGVLGTGTAVDAGSLAIGIHQLTLTAVDSGGRSGSATVQLTIEQATVKYPPVAVLSGPTSGETGQVLTFSGAGSSDPDGTVVNYRFDFGDLSAPVSGTGSSAQHSYQAPGSYLVELEVRDNDGLTHKAQLTVTITQAVRVPVVVDQRPDQLGSMCKLQVTPTGVQIAFRSLTHPSLHLGTWNGTTWSSEQVDGMGMAVGGLVGERFGMTIDPQGVPHLVYVLEDTGIYYATRSGTGWLREQVVPPSASTGDVVSIALNPALGNRPTIAYRSAVGSYQRVMVAVRTGPGTWTQQALTFAATSNEYLAGDVRFDPAGRLYLPYYRSSTTNGSLGRWDGTSVQTLPLGVGIASWASTAWRAPGVLLLLTSAGLLEVQLSTNLPSSTVWHSLVESFATAQHAVAADASGVPKVVVNHGAELELVEPDAAGYWQRFSLGATDNAAIDAVVDGQGQTRACFFRTRKLVLY